MCRAPLQVYSSFGARMLHGKVELIWIPFLRFAPQIQQSFLLPMEIISTSLIVLLSFKEAELTAALPAMVPDICLLTYPDLSDA